MKRCAWLLLLGACAHSLTREPSSTISTCTEAFRILRGPSRRTQSPLLFELADPPSISPAWQAWLARPRFQPNLEALRKSRLRPDMSAAEKFAALADLTLADIVAKPGHMITRAPENVRFFAKDDPFMQKIRVKKKPGQPDKVDRAVLNVITDASGRPTSVDAWDGHHRLLGAMLAWENGTVSRPLKLGDLPAEAFEIHVNGVNADGQLLKTTPPAAGVDFAAAPSWATWNGEAFHSPTRAESRFADIWVNGSVSILTSNLQAPFHSVAVAKIGSEWDVDLAKVRALQQLGIQELLLLPSPTLKSSSVESARAFNAHLEHEGLELRVNVYLGDYDGYVARYQDDAFLRRVQETYVTRSPPRMVNLKTLGFEDTKPLGYDPPLLAP